MKKITLVIDEALLNVLGLSNATDEAVVAGIKNAVQDAAKVPALQDKITTLQNKVTEYETEKTAADEGKVTDMLNAAAEKSLITNELKAVYEKQFKGKPADLKEVLDVLKPYKPVSNNLKEGGEAPKTKKELVAMYDKAFAEGTLQEIKNTNKDQYEALYEAKFGKKPKQD